MRGDQAIENRRPVSANVVPCEKGGGMYGCVAVEVEHGELPACRANLFAVGFASVPLIYGSNKFHQGNGRNCNVPRVVSNQTVNDSRHVSEVQNGDGRVDQKLHAGVFLSRATAPGTCFSEGPQPFLRATSKRVFPGLACLTEGDFFEAALRVFDAALISVVLMTSAPGGLIEKL